MNKKFKQILKNIIIVVLALLVFYLSFAWISACRLEREVERTEKAMEGKNGK